MAHHAAEALAHRLLQAMPRTGFEPVQSESGARVAQAAQCPTSCFSSGSLRVDLDWSRGDNCTVQPSTATPLHGCFMPANLVDAGRIVASDWVQHSQSQSLRALLEIMQTWLPDVGYLAKPCETVLALGDADCSSRSPFKAANLLSANCDCASASQSAPLNTAVLPANRDSSAFSQFDRVSMQMVSTGACGSQLLPVTTSCRSPSAVSASVSSSLPLSGSAANCGRSSVAGRSECSDPLADSDVLLNPITRYILERRRKSEMRQEIEAAKKARMQRSDGAENDGKKSPGYVERRSKNNESARRSRDLKRRKEEEIALRAAFLEQENVKLKSQLAVINAENAKLQSLLFSNVAKPT